MPSRSDGASGSWALERTVAILLGLGAALRLWQYAGNPTLWMDELALGNNLLTRPLGLLLGTPLADGQVAPPGFLIVSRAAVVAFGSSEYALRLFPLLCSLASLPLFARLATRLLRPPAALLAIALFALSPGIAIYAAEGKQYATDVLVTLALTELTLWWLAAPGARRSVALAVGGVVGVFLSQPAVFLLAGLGAALVVGTPRGDRRKPLAPMAFWVTGAVLSVVHARSRMSSGLMNYMHWFWQEGFLPWPVTSLEDALWPLRTLAGLFGLGLGYPWPWAYLTLVACGLVSLFRRARRVALLLAGPIAVTLLAAVAQVYPFQLRLVLFLVPGFVLLVAEGAGLIAERAGQMVERAPGRAVRALLLPAVAAPVAVSLVRNPPVWHLDEMRPVFAELQRRRQPEDAVYAYYPSWQAVRYYGPRYGLGFEAVEIGACHPRDLHDYLRELDRYRGRRVWILFASSARRLGERQAMTAYLDAIGVRRDAIEGPPTNRPGAISARERIESRFRTGAYLYDLTDPSRLASTTADRPSLPPAVQMPGGPRCVYGPVVPQVPTVAAARAAP